MLKRFVMLMLLAVTLAPLSPIHAQDNPAVRAISDTLADLGRRVGRSLTLADFDNSTSKWQWKYAKFSNANLDCPAGGLTSAVRDTEGYIITFVLRGTTFEYRAAMTNRSALILCSSTSDSTTPGKVSASDSNGCPTNLAPRLATGKTGIVLPGDSNRLRVAPSLTAQVTGGIPAGSTFSVVGGPQCSGGMRFWQVTYGGITGWTAEGANGTYWLGPT